MMLTTPLKEPPMGKAKLAPSRETSGAEFARPHIATAATPAEAKSGGTPTAAIRSALRALACKSGRQGVKHLRPPVAQAHDILRERLETGGAVEDYLRGRARLADSAVIGLLHITSAGTQIRGDSMVAPLAAVAVGGYGRSELAPASDLDVLFLLPEASRPRAGVSSAGTAACVDAVVAGLWDLGFTLDHAARSSRECLDLAHDGPAVLAGLLHRRFLWGGYGLFAALDADVAGLFSGPDAARWRRAVCAALTRTRRDGSRDVQAVRDEPDVKWSPGGLRDLQRALAANPLASGRPSALADPTLIEAHRFLWLVRCHLHLLAGRAEDRLRSALQPGVARRLGLDEPCGATTPARLLNRFRHHARNVLQAARSATYPIPLTASIEAP
ncbi:MAG TPA: hypothetical protein VE684_07810 [Crenalkalicoccus sp.]|jgi:[protein-PII] uridylyltransferase|nr:hypothetical protein [Crenalkalicoccus sp.]